MLPGDRPFLTKAVAARRADRRPRWRPNHTGGDRREEAGGSGAAIDFAYEEVWTTRLCRLCRYCHRCCHGNHRGGQSSTVCTRGGGVTFAASISSGESAMIPRWRPRVSLSTLIKESPWLQCCATNEAQVGNKPAWT